MKVLFVSVNRNRKIIKADNHYLTTIVKTLIIASLAQQNIMCGNKLLILHVI